MAEVLTNEQLELSAEDARRVKQFIDNAVLELQKVEDINGGLKDVAKNLAEELNVKPAVLMEAAKVAWKANISDKKTRYEHVETILAAAGRI